jgi:endonuclease/exonuclease/phosphatase family metal-dependent hydrolase
MILRIATYNIRGWLALDERPNVERVAAVLAATGADIIGLNEVYYPRVMPGSEKPALQAVADELGMQFVFGPCMRWPAQDEMPADGYGNALLSRWPIAASASHLLSPVPEKHQRGLLEGRILLPDQRTLTVYVTHLDHTDEEARVAQWRSARAWTGRDRNRPHAVVGDFNAVSAWEMEERPDIVAALRAHPKGLNLVPNGGPRVIAQMEKAGYVDAYRLFGEPGARSLIVPVTPIRIDYVFVSTPLADGVRGCEIWQEPPGEEASDHLAVVAEVELPA